MRWPWERHRDVQAQVEKAEHEYEWAVQNRTTVQELVAKIRYHGEKNNIIENLNIAIRGHE